jgi:drug/metabolite transporter (DMT)-like permease
LRIDEVVARSWSLWIFLVISLIWGLTWIAIKVGIEATPPLFFAAARFVAAGGLLLLVMYRRIDWRGIVRHWKAVLAIAALMTTLAYGLAF